MNIIGTARLPIWPIGLSMSNEMCPYLYFYIPYFPDESPVFGMRFRKPLKTRDSTRFMPMWQVDPMGGAITTNVTLFRPTLEAEVWEK